jgi:hypothetical protein
MADKRITESMTISDPVAPSRRAGVDASGRLLIVVDDRVRQLLELILVELQMQRGVFR